jgi:hypothetical protein
MGVAFRFLLLLSVASWFIAWPRSEGGPWPLFCVLPSPIPADSFLDVTVHNATGQPVVFYKFARWRGQRPGEPLETGEEGVWVYRVDPCADLRGHPAARKEVAFVEAVNEQGQVVFCRRYTYEDLIAAGSRIEINTQAGACR